MISTRGLCFRDMLCYPDIDITRGSVTFLAGESGSGKTTLLRLLNATLTPSSGSVLFDGQDICEMDKIALRRRLILAGQMPYLFRGSVADNFLAYHEIHETPAPTVQEMREYLEVCGIGVDEGASCDVMSGGERQRVFLAIALSMLPEALLLDEPTSAMNHELSHRVLENIINFATEKKITLLIVSHDVSLRERFAQCVVELEGTK